MSLGKVDGLGHFVSEFAPDPEHHVDKKSGSSRFFKKKKDKEKVCSVFSGLYYNDSSKL